MKHDLTRRCGSNLTAVPLSVRLLAPYKLTPSAYHMWCAVPYKLSPSACHMWCAALLNCGFSRRSGSQGTLPLGVLHAMALIVFGVVCLIAGLMCKKKAPTPIAYVAESPNSSPCSPT